MPDLNFKVPKGGEIRSVSRYQDQSVHRGNGSNLAVDKGGRLAQGGQPCPFFGMPSGCLLVIGENIQVPPYNIFQVGFQELSFLGNGEAEASVSELMPYGCSGYHRMLMPLEHGHYLTIRHRFDRLR